MSLKRIKQCPEYIIKCTFILYNVIHTCHRHAYVAGSKATKLFDYKTNNVWKFDHTQTGNRNNSIIRILPKVVSAGFDMIYSGVYQIILPMPSTRVRRDGQDPVEPLAHDGATLRTRCQGKILDKDLKRLGTTLLEASNSALDHSRWRSTIVARAVSTHLWQELSE